MSKYIDREVVEEFESDIAINQKLNHIAMSHIKGKIFVKFINNLTRVCFTLEDAKESCESIEYSPNEEYLAVASYDKNIYIYECGKDEYKLYRTLKKEVGGIMAIDWSMDGKYIRGNCTENEVTIWEVFSEKIIEANKVKDAHWATHNCKLAWDMQPVYPQGKQPDFINCCSENLKLGMFATGDDDGMVDVYCHCCLRSRSAAASPLVEPAKAAKLPCIGVEHFMQKYRGHAGHVGRVGFSES